MSLLNHYSENQLECGCDEAGRGCLAGPVFAAAVILPKDYHNTCLNDSKQLTEKQRNTLRPLIEKEAMSYAVYAVSHEEIDNINILNASFKAMNEAVKTLSLKPELLLIDGNRFKNETDIPFQCIVKGDGKYMSIAAASILAKTYRDEYMNSIHEEFPYYEWNQNKGYPTIAHRQAIEKYGPCKYHRMTFRLIDNQLKLDL